VTITELLPVKLHPSITIEDYIMITTTTTTSV